jgi:hypothetical protein
MAKKIQKCVACNGSGIYDNHGSPKCGACDGLGYERGKIPYRLWKHILIKYYGKFDYEIEKIYESWRD